MDVVGYTGCFKILSIALLLFSIALCMRASCFNGNVRSTKSLNILSIDRLDDLDEVR